MWLFLLFVTIPLIEIALFIQVGGFLGLWPTLAVVIITAILGTALVKAQGLSALSQIQENLHDMRDPTLSIAHGAMILAAGLLLLTPGFFTDAVGFSLLVPAVRTAVFHWVRNRIEVKTFSQTDGYKDIRSNGQVIDGDFTKIDDDKPSNQT